MIRRISNYGWLPDLPDHRDFLYAAPAAVVKELPESIDLRSACPPVYDQGQLGSCTANAISGAIHFDLMKQKTSVFMPSRLFIYYNERVIEHTVYSDSGAMLRDGMKTVNKQGVCPEEEWPYNESEYAQKPFSSCYTDALKHQVLSYHRLTQTVDQMKGCLADGYPFVFGFTVYESFESAEVAKTGVVNLPQSGEGVLGGHAVLTVGYDEPSRRFIARNSWGESWGQKGYFTIPYDYLTNQNLSDDFWTIRTIEESQAKTRVSK